MASQTIELATSHKVPIPCIAASPFPPPLPRQEWLSWHCSNAPARCAAAAPSDEGLPLYLFLSDERPTPTSQ
eukprot:2132251-Rhodomonas_salina.4